jgi:hypothetical protein
LARETTAPESNARDRAASPDDLRTEIEALGADLEFALTRLDTLGLAVAANHVSMSLDLLRARARSLENGDNS